MRRFVFLGVFVCAPKKKRYHEKISYVIYDVQEKSFLLTTLCSMDYTDVFVRGDQKKDMVKMAQELGSSLKNKKDLSHLKDLKDVNSTAKLTSPKQSM